MPDSGEVGRIDRFVGAYKKGKIACALRRCKMKVISIVTKNRAIFIPMPAVSLVEVAEADTWAVEKGIGFEKSRAVDPREMSVIRVIWRSGESRCYVKALVSQPVESLVVSLSHSLAQNNPITEVEAVSFITERW